ncbi:unnamed protein product [Vitrella brassicaformis CCMP3155]|uniref:DNA-directed RNA polymerase RpoA/D/Rpb3-type domain-containing protein n=2 Tax=Vitrella brassicaformis TaxID=1169539 RepID=A0A0G4F5X2_VITBC|nr:unnamed protein product [Vitrella brassicaformis CCMP3155]|eukprot:CEM07616.1 unnamed protein product [Vitrella brassicaformis CCMP3155]
MLKRSDLPTENIKFEMDRTLKEKWEDEFFEWARTEGSKPIVETDYRYDKLKAEIMQEAEGVLPAERAWEPIDLDSIEAKELIEITNKKGAFEGMPVTHWRNRGHFTKFRDFSRDRVETVTKTRMPYVEPEYPRRKLDEWDCFRGIDWTPPKQYERLHKSFFPPPGDTYKTGYDLNNTRTFLRVHSWEEEKTIERDEKLQERYTQPTYVWSPLWEPMTDRRNRAYGNYWCAREEYGDYRMKMNVDEQVLVESSNVTIVPQTGWHYQKLHLGPFVGTMGWSIAPLLKWAAMMRAPGHAVVAVRPHSMNEDKTLNATQEDVLELSLNLKGICFTTREPRKEGRVVVRLAAPADNAAMVTAGMIDWPPFVECTNPEHYVAMINPGETLEMDLKLEWGRGVWMADHEGLFREEHGVENICIRRRDIAEVTNEGFFPIDAVFTPCRRFRFTVHKLDGEIWDATSNPPNMVPLGWKDEICCEIWSDGSCTPKDILLYASNEMQQWFLEMARQLMESVDVEAEEKALEEIKPKMDAWAMLLDKQAFAGGPPMVDWDAPVEELAQNWNYSRLITEEGQQPPGGKQFSIPKTRKPRVTEEEASAWFQEAMKARPYTQEEISDLGAPFDTTPATPTTPTPPVTPTVGQQLGGGLSDAEAARLAYRNNLVTDLPINKRLKGLLNKVGIMTVADVLTYSRGEMLALPGIGKKTVETLEAALRDTFGVTLKPDDD